MPVQLHWANRSSTTGAATMAHAHVERHMALPRPMLTLVFNNLQAGEVTASSIAPMDAKLFSQVGMDNRSALHCCAAGGLLPLIRKAYADFPEALVEEVAIGWRTRKSHIDRPGYPCALVHPMLVAAGSRMSGTLEVLKYYIEERGVDVDRRSYQNISALHCAIAAGESAKIRYLVSRLPPATLDQHVGGTPALPLATPLAYAAYRGELEAVELMVKRGADLNRYSPAPEELWAHSCRVLTPLVAAIFGLKHKNFKDDDRRRVLRGLLRLRADPNQGGNGTRRAAASPKALPLRVALQQCDCVALTVLLANGADPTAVNGGCSYTACSLAWYAITQIKYNSLAPSAVDALVAYGGGWNPHCREVATWKAVAHGHAAYNKAVEIEELRKLYTTDQLCAALGFEGAAKLQLSRDSRSLLTLRKSWSTNALLRHGVWRPTTHTIMPTQFQEFVAIVLQCAAAIEKRATSALPALPFDMWALILSHVDRSSANKPFQFFTSQ